MIWSNKLGHLKEHRSLDLGYHVTFTHGRCHRLLDSVIQEVLVTLYTDTEGMKVMIDRTRGAHQQLT